MKKIIVWQIIMLMVAMVISTLVWNVSAMSSALFGGLSYFIPTILSVFILVKMKKFQEVLIALIMVEVIKIFLVCLIMIVVFFCYQAVNWLAFLLGLIFVSQAGMFTISKRWVL